MFRSIPPAIAATRRATGAAWERLEALGWAPVGRLGAGRLNRALARELPADHPLAGTMYSAVARAEGQDDVAYALADGRLALVHLTYGPPVGTGPSVGYLPDVDALLGDLAMEGTHVATLLRSEELAAAMGPGRAVCPACGSDWGMAEARGDCPVCDGWALVRPCPVCEGRCGALWDRAVTDSADMAAPVFLGRCGLPKP